MLMPMKDKLERKRGSTAQWMAQATEAPIPNTSAFKKRFLIDRQR